MTDSAAFAADLTLAGEYCLILIETYNRVRADAVSRLGLPEASLPAPLAPAPA